MIELGELLILQNQSLGTTETRMFTNEMRVQAINTAIIKILMVYDLLEFIQEYAIHLTAGVGNEPTDLLRVNYLCDLQDNPYELVDFETFRENIGFTYKREYNRDGGVYRIKVSPQRTGSVVMTYIVKPPLLVNSTDTISLKPHWAEAIAEKSTAILLRNARQYDVASDKDASAEKMINDAFQNDRPGLQGRALTRIQSIYERRKMFAPSAYNFNSVSSPILTWLNINSNTQMLPMYGYFVNGTAELTLPLSMNINVGDIIRVVQQSGTWTIAQNADQYIVFGNQQTTVGTGGYLQSTDTGDSLELIYRGNNVFEVISSIGNITVV